jgi:hypothetical protein
MHGVQVAESIKLEKTELEFELGQLTGQVERLQTRIRTLIEEQVKTPNYRSPIFVFSYITGFVFRLFKLQYYSQGCLQKYWHLFIGLKANAYKICTKDGRK